MRLHGHRSVRSWFALTAAAAAASSGLLIAGMSSAAASTSAVITVLPNSGRGISEVTEGKSVEGLVAKFTDSANTGPNTNCGYAFYQAVIHWGDNTTSGGTITCERVSTAAEAAPTGVFDVGGSHVYSDSGSYVISVSVTDTERGESAGPVNTATASISDANLSYDDYKQAPVGGKAVEGTSVTVGAAFFDDNQSFSNSEGPRWDPMLTGSINWGDGSALQSVAVANPPTACGCVGDAWISASHVYDALNGDAGYTVTITAKDDGGATAKQTINLTISDAKLTAGNPPNGLSATAAQSTSAVVASFTDAAAGQASAADFSATVNWGDSASSAGTVTQTDAGAFNVSGTHTYASAGTRTLTITVTDQEGQTLSLSATATVAAAPAPPAAPATLALTGRPTGPWSPWPVLVLGLLAIVTGFGAILMRRPQR